MTRAIIVEQAEVDLQQPWNWLTADSMSQCLKVIYTRVDAQAHFITKNTGLMQEPLWQEDSRKMDRWTSSQIGLISTGKVKSMISV